MPEESCQVRISPCAMLLANVFILTRVTIAYIPDISICRSKWATATDLANWFIEAHKLVVAYKEKYDKSGIHDFDYGESFDPTNSQAFEQFCNDFVNGQKSVMYLAALMYHRGQETLDFFSSDMPPSTIAINGMEPEEDNDDRQSLGTRGTNGGREDFGGNEDDDSSLVGRLTRAIQGGNDSSPKKEEYFKARTEQIKEETERQRQRSGLDSIAAKFAVVKACSESINTVATNVSNIAKQAEGTDFQADAKARASKLWELTVSLQEELETTISEQASPKRRRTAESESEPRRLGNEDDDEEDDDE